MIYYHVGNLLNAPQIYIAHQVNCQGKMGSGVAKAVWEKYPKAYEWYMGKCENDEPKNLLGFCQKVPITAEPPKEILNLFGQLNYGYDDKLYTSYVALTIALNDVFKYIVQQNDYFGDSKEIALPYRMGCDRGGGKWEIVASILEDLSEKYEIDVDVYSLKGYGREDV